MSAPTDDADAGVIPYATPEPRRTDGPFARGHATLAVVALAALSLDVAALLSGVEAFISAAVLLHFGAAFLTPVVILLRRPGSIHWVAGTLFFLGMVAGIPAALWVFMVVRMVLGVTPPSRPAIPVAVGPAVFAVGLYVERRTRSRIRRLTTERTPRGFEVVKPADPSHHR